MKEYILKKKKLFSFFDVISLVGLLLVLVLLLIVQKKILWAGFLILAALLFIPNIYRKLKGLLSSGEEIIFVDSKGVKEYTGLLSYTKKKTGWDEVKSVNLLGNAIVLDLGADKDGRPKMRQIDIPYFRKDSIAGFYDGKNFQAVTKDEAYQVFKEYYEKYRRNQI